MKNILFTIATIALGFSANAQVGIGTTTPSSSSMLDITSTSKGFLKPRMTTAQRTAVASPAKGLEVFDTDFNSTWFFDGSAWLNAASTTNYWTSVNGNLYNNAGSNLGIGTTIPSAKLEVVGQMIKVTNAGGAAIFSASNGTSELRVQNNNGAGFIGTMQANAFEIYTNGSPRITTLSNGNVGIGTTAPSSTLHVNGTITAAKIQGPSDSRFKKNIKPIENALEKVLQLGGYTYDWKEASEFPNQTLGKGHDMGVIAQEVEKQFPEAVSTNADGFKAVSYTELVPALIEAIKTLNSQVNELRAEVKELKK